MSRFTRSAVVFAMFVALAAGAVFAQGQRSLMERKTWYVDDAGKVKEMLYWRIFLGDYNDVKLKRNVPGKGQIDVSANMNFQFLSSGYIEGNGHSAHGRMQSLPGLRLREGSKVETIKFEEIDYIYDYGTKVAMKDGKKGDFLIGGELDQDMEVKRFNLSEYRMVKGSFGELELKEFQDRVPIRALSLTKEGAARAAREPVTTFDD